MKNKSSQLVKYSALFNKQLRATPLKIKLAFRDARELFLENPNHSSLRSYSLKEKFTGYRSIDITEDYRAIYRKSIGGKKDIITFYLIGTHEELYGKKH